MPSILSVSRPKILFISTQLPYPPKSGGTVKSWNYINYLTTKYAVSCACFLKDDDEKHQQEFQKAVYLVDFFAEPLAIQRSPINLIKSYLTAPCLNVFRNRSNSFKKAIEGLSHQQEIIIVDHYEMFQYVPASFSGKIIMHTHNAEFMLWQRMSELTGNPLKKLVLGLESKRVKKYEEQIFQEADLIYSTPSDIELYKNHGFKIEKHRETYHLGNESLLQLPELKFEATEKAITFMGTMSWEPNIDGIVWFLDKVWPRIKTQESDCKLYLLGSNPDARIVKATNNDPNVIFPGFVKDLDTYLKKTRVYIAPLRFGSGMKVKVLEGLYRGNPTVSTSVGAEGLAVKHRESILIADDAKSFAQACIDLINQQAIWENISKNSRKLANQEYRWEPLFESMDESLRETL